MRRLAWQVKLGLTGNCKNGPRDVGSAWDWHRKEEQMMVDLILGLGAAAGEQ